MEQDKTAIGRQLEMSVRRKLWGGLALLLTLSTIVAACGGDDNGATDSANGSGSLSGSIAIDGSSTVAPLSEAAAEGFMKENKGVKVTVGTSGTGGGFEKFCNGETDISDASRPIKPEEAAACKKAGVEYRELQVANDGLSVVVNKDNDWATCLTVAQLKKMWEPAAEGKIKNWNQIDPSFPDQRLDLFGAGTDSGTFDYFTAAINGEEDSSRSDYNATEDDNVTVQGVAGSKGGIGYFGLSYYEQNQDKLKVVQIDGGDGCVTPTTETVQSGEYKPLSRPLFIYPKKELLDRPEGKAFVDYYEKNIDTLTEQALFVDLTEEQKAQMSKKIKQLGI
jgi:phosphate transport system substrate-binding protein